MKNLISYFVDRNMLPVYELLNKDLKGDVTIPLSTLDQDELLTNVTKLEGDKNAMELMYAIIFKYDLEEGTHVVDKGKVVPKKTGVKFDFEFLPAKLQHLLLAFTRLHLGF